MFRYNYYNDAECSDLWYRIGADTDDSEFGYFSCSGCEEYIKVRIYDDEDDCDPDKGYNDVVVPYGCIGIDVLDLDVIELSWKYTCGDDWIQIDGYGTEDCSGDTYYSVKYDNGCGTTTATSTLTDSVTITYEDDYYIDIIYCAANYYYNKILLIAMFIVYAAFI